MWAKGKPDDQVTSYRLRHILGPAFKKNECSSLGSGCAALT